VVRVYAVNELSLKYTELSRKYTELSLKYTEPNPMALEVEIALERYGRCKPSFMD